MNEYAERGTEYGILFIFSLFYEYIHLKYVRIHVIYRVNQAEFVIHKQAVAPQEYVNIYSTCMRSTPTQQPIPWSSLMQCDSSCVTRRVNPDRRRAKDVRRNASG